MSAYIYSGLHTGESEAYRMALNYYLDVFFACPSGNYSWTGAYGTVPSVGEQDRLDGIAINPTGSGYAVSNGVTSGIFGNSGPYSGVSGWTAVTITPSLNPDYSPKMVGRGCTRKDSYNNFLLASGEASQGDPSCPICLSSGTVDASGAARLPVDAVYLINFSWELQHISHEYGAMSTPPPIDWCVYESGNWGEPECPLCSDFGILTGWTTFESGTETVELHTGASFNQHSNLEGYTGQVGGWTALPETAPDVRIMSDMMSGGAGGFYSIDGEDKWVVDFRFMNHPAVFNNPNKHNYIGAASVTTYYNSGNYDNCLSPTTTGIPLEHLKRCYAEIHGLTHPTGGAEKYAAVTWRAKVISGSISRLGDYGTISGMSYVGANPDNFRFETYGEFSDPSICDVYKYFHYYDCHDIQSIQNSSSLDNCQVLEALEAAPESGHRVKMPAVQWDFMMTGSNWSRTENPNGTSDDCTISNLGSGTSFAYASFGDGTCGALIQRIDDSGNNWTDIGHVHSIGYWSGNTYIDNQGCSGCFKITGSGNNPPPGLFSGCSGYNACVDASGHYAGC